MNQKEKVVLTEIVENLKKASDKAPKNTEYIKGVATFSIGIQIVNEVRKLEDLLAGKLPEETEQEPELEVA